MHFGAVIADMNLSLGKVFQSLVNVAVHAWLHILLCNTAAHLVSMVVLRNNVTLSMQRRVPHAVATHIATWITILSPFTKVSFEAFSKSNTLHYCVRLACSTFAAEAENALIVLSFAVCSDFDTHSVSH